LRFWSSSAGFFLNPFWKIKIVRQPPKGYKPSDTLLMVNHASAADAWVVSRATFPWELKYIFKSAMYRLPVAGWSIYLSNDIPIHFTSAKGGWGTEKGSVSEAMDRVKYLQDLGIGQVIFPEGTRSRTGRLQLFKDGFFRFALEHGCEILPCVHHNTQKLWPMGSHWYGCDTVYFAFGDPIRVKMGECSVDELKERVRGEMEKLFSYCPLYDPVKESPLDELPTSRGLGLIGSASPSAK